MKERITQKEALKQQLLEAVSKLLPAERRSLWNLLVQRGIIRSEREINHVAWAPKTALNTERRRKP